MVQNSGVQIYNNLATHNTESENASALFSLEMVGKAHYILHETP